MPGGKRYESPGDVQAREQAASLAAVETAAAVKRLQQQMDDQRAESAEESRASRRRELVTITIALLTLGATVLFGILALLY